ATISNYSLSAPIPKRCWLENSGAENLWGTQGKNGWDSWHVAFLSSTIPENQDNPSALSTVQFFPHISPPRGGGDHKSISPLVLISSTSHQRLQTKEITAGVANKPGDPVLKTTIPFLLNSIFLQLISMKAKAFCKGLPKPTGTNPQCFAVQPQPSPIWGGKEPAAAAAADTLQPSFFSASRPWREPNSPTCTRTLLPPATPQLTFQLLLRFWEEQKSRSAQQILPMSHPEEEVALRFSFPPNISSIVILYACSPSRLRSGEGRNMQQQQQLTRFSPVSSLLPGRGGNRTARLAPGLSSHLLPPNSPSSCCFDSGKSRKAALHNKFFP
ncbi:hypothetical protein E2320_014449, partial [Naja naja]